MADQILIDFQVNNQGLQQTIDLLEKLGNIDKKTADEFRAANKAYEERKKVTVEAGKAAEDFGKKSETASHKATAATKEHASELDRLGDRIQRIGERIVAAYSIEKLAEFSVEAVKASAAAELAATKLDFSITKVLGGTKEQVKELTDQSEELSKSSFFSPRQITEAQNLQAQFGLTAEQIKKLTPLIEDLAVAQNVDLNTATGNALRAIEGTSKGLKTVGADFKDTGSKVGNFNKLTEGLTKLQGAAANALNTTTGELKNQEKETEILQEQIGKKLTPIFLAFKQAEVDILSGAEATISFFGKLVDNLSELSSFEVPDIFKNFTDSVDGAKKEIEGLVNESKKEFGDLGLPEIQKKLLATSSLLKSFGEEQKKAEEGTDEADKKRTRRNVINLFAQQQALKQLLEEKQNQLDFENKIADVNLNESKEVENLEKIKNGNTSLAKSLKDRFKVEIEIINARKDAATAANKDEVKKREDAIKKIEDAEKEALKKGLSDREAGNKRLFELDKKAREQDLVAQGQNAIDKLKAEQKNREDEIQLAFDASSKGKKQEEDRDDALLHIRQEFHAKIEDEEEKHLKHLQELQHKFDAAFKADGKGELDKKLNEVTDSANKQTKALIDYQIASGDFSKKTERENADEISRINIDATEKKIELLKKISDFDEEAKKEQIGLEKDLTDQKKELYQRDYDNRQAAYKQAYDASKQLIGAISQIFNNYYDSQAQSIEENKQKVLDGYDEQLAANEELHNKEKRGDREYEKQKTDLLNKRQAEEKKADKELKKIKHDQAVYNRDIAILNATLSGIEGVARAFADYAYPYDLVVAAVVGGLALAEVTAAATTPIPSYAKGVEKITGKGTETSDSVPANLSVGERVVSARRNRDFFPILSAIHNERFSPAILNEIAKMTPEQLKALPILTKNGDKPNIHETIKHLSAKERLTNNFSNEKYSHDMLKSLTNISSQVNNRSVIREIKTIDLPKTQVMPDKKMRTDLTPIIVKNAIQLNNPAGLDEYGVRRAMNRTDEVIKGVGQYIVKNLSESNTKFRKPWQ